MENTAAIMGTEEDTSHKQEESRLEIMAFHKIIAIVVHTSASTAVAYRITAATSSAGIEEEASLAYLD